MELIISYSDYESYHGEAIPDEEFERYASRACEAVDDATMGRLRSGWNQLGAIDRERVKLACCAQTEYLYLQGVETALGMGGVASYSIGKTQVTLAGGASGARGLCPKAHAVLLPTGLLYRGVNICGC